NRRPDACPERYRRLARHWGGMEYRLERPCGIVLGFQLALVQPVPTIVSFLVPHNLHPARAAAKQLTTLAGMGSPARPRRARLSKNAAVEAEAVEQREIGLERRIVRRVTMRLGIGKRAAGPNTRQ